MFVLGYHILLYQDVGDHNIQLILDVKVELNFSTTIWGTIAYLEFPSKFYIVGLAHDFAMQAHVFEISFFSSQSRDTIPLVNSQLIFAYFVKKEIIEFWAKFI
jgi:hypothetical protein